MKPRSLHTGMDDPLIAKFRDRFDSSGSGEPFTFSESAELFGAYLKLHRRAARIARISDIFQSEMRPLLLELQEAQANVKTLTGYIPICASCKKIRNDAGYWNQVEQYISEHSDALFSHGICPECAANYDSLSRKNVRQTVVAARPIPAHALDETDLDDPVIARFLPILKNEQLSGTPLYDDFCSLFQRYVRLTKRMKRIARISDNYQTQLQELKGQLKGLNLSLMQQVEEETEKRLAQERLLARNTRLAAMGEMIGAIAHQWRQPLATLGATIQSIRMAWERDRLDGAFMERMEADAQKQLSYMSDTIEEFRNFFKPEKEVERFAVNDRLNDVVLLVGAQFANSGITLRVIDDAEEPVEVNGYPNEFKQVVLNLVSNARDSILDRWHNSPQTGMTPDVAGSILLVISSDADTVRVEVRDNGCGIPSEIADKVFDPYFTTKPEGKGTGIGLYMSKLIIEESMGGHLDFQSGSTGTSFRITLNKR